jgi:hypothetical protein
MLKIFAPTLVLIVVGTAAAAQSRSESQCSQLPCQRCEALCTTYCAAESKGKRAGAYRGCTNGCKADLCAQCMPVQYDATNRKFFPGRTDLCRSPGRYGKPN